MTQYTYDNQTVTAIGTSPWTTEQPVPGMDATGLQPYTYCTVTGTFKWSLSLSGSGKASAVRLRVGSLTGTILQQQNAGDQGDSTAGNQNTMTINVATQTDANGRIVLTLQDTNSNAPWYSAQRTMTVSDPLDASTTSAAKVFIAPLSGGFLLVNTLGSPAGSLDYRVNGGTVVNTGTQMTQVTGLTNGTAYTIDVRAHNGSTYGPWSTFTITPNAVLMYDSFNRSDVSPSGTALGTSDDGHTWSQSGSTGISSGMAYTTTAAENYGYVAGSFNIDVTLYTPIAQSGTNTDVGIMFRMRDTSNAWLVQYTSTGVYLFRKIGGTWNQLWSRSISTYTTALLRVVAYGTWIRVYVNGVILLSIEDSISVAATDTQVGFRIGQTSGRVDWLYAQAAAADPEATTKASWIYKGRDSQSLDTVGAA